MLKIGNTQQKIAKIKELLNEEPEFVRGWLELGKIYRQVGDRQSALGTFAKAVELSPQNVNARLKLTDEQFYLQHQDCRKNIEKILATNPYNVEAVVMSAKLYQREKKCDLALQSWELASALKPESTSISLSLALQLQQGKKFVAAEQVLKQALEHNPGYFSLLMQFGRLKRESKDLEAALYWFSLASQKAPSINCTVNAELSKIDILKALNRIEEAIAAIKPIIIDLPQNIRAKLIYAVLLIEKLDFKTAAEVYQSIIALDAEHLEAYLRLARCWNMLSQSQQAIEILENALSFAPHNIQVVKQLGDLYRQQRNLPQALNYYQKYLDIDSKSLTAHLNVALVLRESNDLPATKKILSRTLKYYPDNFTALTEMARLEFKLQRTEAALKYWQKIIATYPDKIESRLEYIDILYELNRIETAKAELTNLEQKYPELFDLLKFSGRFYSKLGQRKKALSYFRLAQERAIKPSDSADAELLAIVELKELGDLEKAECLLRNIIQQFPDRTQAKMLLGSILQKKLDFIGAIDIYYDVLATANHLNPRIELAKSYAQLGRTEEALLLLIETHQLLGANLKTLIQLGKINEARENWLVAKQWYQKICQKYPDRYQGYCLLANIHYSIGERETALNLLNDAKDKFQSVEIIVDLARLQISIGNLSYSHRLIANTLNHFPHDVRLRLELCRVEIELGNYHAALDILEQVSTDRQDWVREIQRLKAEIYFFQYDYQKAEIHLRQAIALAPIAVAERNRLATILVARGKIEEAYHELKTATWELNLKTPLNKVTLPLRSQSARLINELRINPPLVEKLKSVYQKTGHERILELGSILTEDPTYFGTALYLAKELRLQGVFAKIEQILSQKAENFPTIPRIIVQYWDRPNPPAEIQRICQSWNEHNPEYKYLRFSASSAIAFLEENYDRRVIEAFGNCDLPATQADLFRLAYLNKCGGFYADTDDLCRKSLEAIVNLRPELVVAQEHLACIGNNFIGCIPNQTIIRLAFEQAVNNLTAYQHESPWLKTGPGLLTSMFSSSLVDYLKYQDYQMWPRLLVLTQAQLKKIITQHISLNYKKKGSWQHAAQRKINAVPI